jgi:hypothetical protein
MLKQVIDHLLQRDLRVPEEYARMVRAEYRNVPFDYVEYHLQTYKRLPTPEELQNAL